MQHITIAPGLLEELAKPLLEGKVPVESLFESPAVVEGAVPGKEVSYVGDEAGYRIAFTRDANGLSEEKLTQVSVVIFSCLVWWLLMLMLMGVILLSRL